VLAPDRAGLLRMCRVLVLAPDPAAQRRVCRVLVLAPDPVVSGCTCLVLVLAPGPVVLTLALVACVLGPVGSRSAYARVAPRCFARRHPSPPAVSRGAIRVAGGGSRSDEATSANGGRGAFASVPNRSWQGG
jgi:hypothetical protein